MFILAMVLIGIISFLWLLLNRSRHLGFIMTAALFIVFIFFHQAVHTDWLSWLLFIILLGWIFSATEAPKTIKPAFSKNADETGIIHVHEGDLTGAFNADHTVELYAGIPYAKPPTGNLRWKEPQDPEPYSTILHAVNFAPMAMQKKNSMFMNSIMDLILYKNWNHILHERVRYLRSEDCLYLNIWKPAGIQEKLPVVFYIHGGSLTNGQSWWEDYQGESYAKQNVIFITFAYRLGAFGFFADEQLQKESEHHITGMYGFLDQIKALEWVNKNIASFGGDPDNITIAGESAGSSCVNAMCTSPLARGLFQKAIGESSSITAKHPAHSFISLEDALIKGKELKKAFHTVDIQVLRQMPASAIAQCKTSYNTLNALCLDGYALKETPYESYLQQKHNEAALLNGYNAHDGDYFALYAGKIKLSNYYQKIKELYQDQTDAVIGNDIPHNDSEASALYRKLLTEYLFGYGHIVWSRLASQNEPVYTYFFAKNNRKAGANHTGELQYAYGNLDADKKKYDETDYALSSLMQKYWLNFILNGNPNGKDLPEWNTFDNQSILRLDENPAMIPLPSKKADEALDTLQDNSSPLK